MIAIEPLQARLDNPAVGKILTVLRAALENLDGCATSLLNGFGKLGSKVTLVSPNDLRPSSLSFRLIGHGDRSCYHAD
jgi:hypothetical protein